MSSMTAIPIRDRHPPILPQRPVRDLHPGRRLTAFVFTAVHECDDVLHRAAIEACGGQVGEALVLLHVSPNDGIEDFIWWEGVLIRLKSSIPSFGDTWR